MYRSIKQRNKCIKIKFFLNILKLLADEDSKIFRINTIQK